MASFKELSLSRPFPQSTPRHHSHSISLGAVNSNHRVTRRKSVTTAAAANAAAAVASLKDSSDSIGVAMPVPRRGSRKGLESSSVGATSTLSSYLSRSVNSPSRDSLVARKTSPSQRQDDTPMAQTAVDGSVPPGKPVSTKNRNRRASEGSHLVVKGEGKGSRPELRCDRCGKGYKHGSCLSKHMWEHDPAWAITSKLLISKHQQVQLLEAASVLVNMNVDDPTAESAEAESEISSASPDASSELRDSLSSAETTPPPMDEDDRDDDMLVEPEKRFEINSAGPQYSHSFQSIPSSSFTGSAPWPSPMSSHFHHSSVDTRPSTAEAKLHDDDEADLAAAIGLCNFGTPRMGPMSMSPGVPPVPPLPSRFLDQAGSAEKRGLAQSGPSIADTTLASSNKDMFLSLSYNPSLSYKVSDEREVRMGSRERSNRRTRNADVDFGSRPTHADDGDEGVFGRMEE
ncbi:putative C2H2 finger domain protein [Aspergillus lucknowensis]|uniref:C2H2-type domain-containing protein n=1 Tax=Aspergillus lucknowensis TaxID=176173 RepID=A0ABR4LVV4_9EURO